MSSRTLERENKKADSQSQVRRPVIVISGSPGSGKSTYAKRLAGDLKLKYFNTGEIFREIAKERGLSLIELSRLAEDDPSIDLEIDRRTLQRALGGGVVIDSHLAGWVLSDIADFSVYLKAPVNVRVFRISERERKNISVTLTETLKRELSQWNRFNKYYGYDLTDLNHFDLIIDTSILDINEIYYLLKKATVLTLCKKGFRLDSCFRDL